MAERLGRHLYVETCIACGARSRAGDCEEGCSEVPLDLVEAAELVPLWERRAAIEQRSDALQRVAEEFAADPQGAWDRAREAGHDALKLVVPPQPPAASVIAAWGCPSCGRVDAPQPCLDVCIRRPVEMADAAEYRELVADLAAAAARERALAEVVRLIVHVQPRADALERSRDALQDRAFAVLREHGGG